MNAAIQHVAVAASLAEGYPHVPNPYDYNSINHCRSEANKELEKVPISGPVSAGAYGSVIKDLKFPVVCLTLAAEPAILKLPK
jgi:hypothetical protein